MAENARSTTAPAADPHSPDAGVANDNTAGPTKAPCRWHMLITAMKPICMRTAVWLAQQRLRGCDFDETCDVLMAALDAARAS